MGFTHIGELSVKSAMYVAKYSLKSAVSGEENIVGMSRRPGLGLEYIRRLGWYYAKRVPEIGSLPAGLKIGGNLLPMDRNAKAAFEMGYLEEGGAIGANRGKHVHHLVAIAYERLKVGLVNEEYQEAEYWKLLKDVEAKTNNQTKKYRDAIPEKVPNADKDVSKVSLGADETGPLDYDGPPPPF